MKDAIETIVGPNSLKAHILYSTNPINPRVDYDNGCKMWCWHRRYTLGDRHKHEDVTSAVKDIWCDYGTEEDRKAYISDWMKGLPLKDVKRFCRSIELIRFDKKDRRDVLFDSLLDQSWRPTEIRLPSRVRWLPLFLYDHGGLSISAGAFNCPWDSGVVGFIWTAEETFKDEWIKDEVLTYDKYLQGEQYDLIIMSGDDTLEISGPFWGTEDAIAEAHLYFNQEQTEVEQWIKML